MANPSAIVGAVRGLATADYFPRVSHAVRRAVKHPLGILGLAIGVAVLCGLAVHPRVFVLAGGLAAVATAGVCWPWLTTRSARGTIRFDRERANEQESCSATIEVVNYLPWPAIGLVIRGGFGNESQCAVRLPRIPMRSAVSARWQFHPERRGEYPLGTPCLGTGFPFGVWESQQPATASNRLIVWPLTFPVGPVPTAGEEAPDGSVARSKVGSTGEVLGVRPYRRGDSPRRIHWRQSAKHDRLVVCELQSNARPVVLLVLDTQSRVHTLGKDGSREWAIRITASLAKGWLAEGAQVGVAWDGLILPPASGQGQVERILDALARIPEQGSRPLSELLRMPNIRSSRAGVTIAITSELGTCSVPIDGLRWVVLNRDGFPDGRDVPPRDTASTEPQQRISCWLELPNPLAVLGLLRSGWSEAKHGS